jgi:hypothetical protein
LVALFAIVSVMAGPVVGSAVAAPVDSTPPEVQNAGKEGPGVGKLGEAIRCSSGSWSGAVSKFEFEWVRNGVAIEGATFATYTLSKADEGKEVWCIVTAVGEGARVTVESWNSVEFGAKEVQEAPTNTSPPEVKGTPEVGQPLKCESGVWKGQPTPTFSYEWLRDGAGIPSATSQTYTVSSEDEGDLLSCKVTAENTAGKAFAVSKNSLEVKGHEPKNTELPHIEGLAVVGETLTCNKGIWSGTKPLTYKFQWRLEGSAIGGANGETLPVESADEGKKLSCEVEAKNSVGKGFATSPQITVGIRPPENTTPPKITGEAVVGRELTCSEGVWTGSPTKYEFRWFRENEELSSQTNKYTITSKDPGHKLFCVVTAINGGGKGTSESAAFVVPEGGGQPPVDKEPPTISGAGAAGEELACSEGQWLNGPTSFEYQWVRDKTVSIPGATKAKYRVQTADEGHSLTCQVKANNKFGSGEAESAPLPITGQKPNPLEAPTISVPGGTARVGETVTCLHGAWEAAPAPTFTYKWLRDGTEQIGTKEFYTLVGADQGNTLTCVVTASNSEGSTEKSSAGLEVPGFAPQVVQAPRLKVVDGNAVQVGAVLMCEEGTWNAAPKAEVKYEWLVGGESPPGETKSTTYRVALEDEGRQIACRVTETNLYGQQSADSNAELVPGMAPKDLVLPKINPDGGGVGVQLTCSPGIWEGKPPPSFAYRWYREGQPISSATSNTYTVETADQGHRLSCVVIATNVQESVEAESSNSVIVPPARQTESASQAQVLGTSSSSSGVLDGLTTTQVRNSLVSQIARAIGAAHISKVLKAGGYSFSFIGPAAGTLEVQAFELVKKGHHEVRITLLSGIVRFTKSSRATVRLKLTREGKRILEHKQRFKLSVSSDFKVQGGVSASWSGAVTIKH